jgi:2-polyprenyl-3-methyl-5-hydroxy-6-metoxy-1,4-benzoquinol methylase
MPHRWSNSAELRRNQIESGIDLTFNEVFRPLFVEKIAALAKYSILEVGAGTGHLSKALASEGRNITAIEPSDGMFSVAKDVLADTGVNLINCASWDLPADTYYEVAISHLVAHVVDDVAAFFRSIAAHLETSGHFIFSIPHPCFFNGYKKIFSDGYQYMKSAYQEIAFTITKDQENQISGVPYHHRPLSIYVNTLVAAGFAIDGFEETWPSAEIQALYGKEWENPRYCLFACKKL